MNKIMALMTLPIAGTTMALPHPWTISLSVKPSGRFLGSMPCKRHSSARWRSRKTFEPVGLSMLNNHSGRQSDASTAQDHRRDNRHNSPRNCDPVHAQRCLLACVGIARKLAASSLAIWLAGLALIPSLNLATSRSQRINVGEATSTSAAG